MTKFKSSLGIKYPTLRDDPLKTGVRWLEGKRADDGAEGLWRIHDGLYDFTEFIEKHPGGVDWLQLTKGTDITEAFETHHLTETPGKLLGKFFVRQTQLPRNSPFTFKDDGFYKTLKRRIVAQLGDVPKAPIQRSKRIADCLVAAYVVMALLAVIYRSFTCGMLSGILLSLTAIAAHNFFHQKDNFRMYYFNLTLMEYRDWRISHALSHHLHTNTINDLEISSLEPFIEYLPGAKHVVVNKIKTLLSPAIYCFFFFGSYVNSIAAILARRKTYDLFILLPFSVLFLMVLVSGDVVFCTLMFFWIQLSGSLHFGAVGVNAAHHHPDIFHDGDAPREWRIIHALSHHLHTNTINDFEITALEPFIEYLPGEKNVFERVVKVVISPFVYLFISLGSFVRRIAEIVLGKNDFNIIILLPFILLPPMYLASGSLLITPVMFVWIQLVASLHFGAVGLNGGHHHPDIFHDGDAPRPTDEMDWGIFQLDAVIDRKQNISSHFWVLTNFGNHALHHLFPTVDHGLLEYLYPCFFKTCAEFGVEWRYAGRLELVKGQIQQIAKCEPRVEPPRPLRPVRFP